jgi:cytochrome b
MPKPARIDPPMTGLRDGRRRCATVPVWDPVVRIFHWSLVASMAASWFTSTWRDAVHNNAGYIAAGLILARVLWGLIGPRYARFSQFCKAPGHVLAYLRAVLAGREARHIGHNPAGGVMVVTLMASVLATAFTGWMMTTDRWFGVDWVQTLHRLSADAVVALVVVHLGGVVVTSLRQRENLVKAMVTGQKRPAESGDVA